MIVLVNGSETPVSPGSTIADLVAAHARSAEGIAVALNEVVVVRSRWPATPVQERDRIELLGAAQGG